MEVVGEREHVDGAEREGDDADRQQIDHEPVPPAQPELLDVRLRHGGVQEPRAVGGGAGPRWRHLSDPDARPDANAGPGRREYGMCPMCGAGS